MERVKLHKTNTMIPRGREWDWMQQLDLEEKLEKKKPQEWREPDYYVNDDGYKVMTEAHHKRRGFCCKNGCKHCPY